MAADLQITEGSGGKFVHTLEKTASIHTSITAIDIGAGTTETRLVAGQAAGSASVPVVLASDQVSALALANGMSNPTTILAGAFTMVYNNSTWDRVMTGQGDAVGSGQRIPITPFAFNGSTYDRIRGDTTGLWVQVRAGTAGGVTSGKLISAATTNATVIKASAGQLYFLHIVNLNAAVRYFKLYNKATSPTVGTDTPVLTLAIPGNTAGAGFTLSVPQGIEFATGIGFATTTGSADADTAAVAAGDVLINYGYK